MSDDHLSIGEVLSLLQDDFPDVTISKIRFLESQGLIDPERTPSGYRKFYAADIERLRWILTQQREHFLPLKVIKDRLDEQDGAAGGGAAPPSGGPSSAPSAPLSFSPDASAHAPAPTTVRASMPAGELPSSAEPQPIWMADLARSNRAERAPADRRPPAVAVTIDDDVSDVSLTATELQQAAGISADQLRELVQYGLVVGRPMGDDTYFDGDALVVARTAASFLGHGIGARHLRMYKVAAEREAGFLEQLAMPLLKQRNPEARRNAVRLVEELAGHGHDLRAALLRANLRQHLDRT